VLSIPAVQAHTPLLHSVPENGATLETAPAEFVLTFKKKVKLVLLRLKGGSIDLKLRPEINAEKDKHALTLPELSTGSYTATWRAIGKDGHVMKGSIPFSIQP